MEELWIELIKIGGSLLTGGGLAYGGARVIRSRSTAAAVTLPATPGPSAAACKDFRADLRADVTTSSAALEKRFMDRMDDTSKQFKVLAATTKDIHGMVHELSGFVRGRETRT